MSADVIDLVEHRYEPAIDRLEARIEDLPEWCREAVAHTISMARAGALLCRQRGERIAELERDNLVMQNEVEYLNSRLVTVTDARVAEREQLQYQITQLIDPIVRAKMLEPSPSILVSNPEGIVTSLAAERDALRKRIDGAPHSLVALMGNMGVVQVPDSIVGKFVALVVVP